MKQYARIGRIYKSVSIYEAYKKAKNIITIHQPQKTSNEVLQVTSKKLA